MARIVDVGELMEGRPDDRRPYTSGGPDDVLKKRWPRPDFARAARTGATSVERAVLFDAIYRNVATRPAPIEIDGVAGSWPPLWRSSVRTLRAMWESGEGSSLVDIRIRHDAVTAALSDEATRDLAPFGTGRRARGGEGMTHGLDLHPAIAAAAAWLPLMGWPNDARMTFDHCYAAMPAHEGGSSWLQAVEIRGRDWSRIGEGLRHATVEDALEELRPLAAKLIAARQRDEAIGVSGRALGPGGVRVGPPNPRRSGRSRPEHLVEALGLRGVEFGRGIGQRDRQEVCDLAFDAMFDLCQVMRMPAPTASLWGRAGLAFGSRGMGPGVMGHFDPRAFVVHMDGWSGAGVLAHEMGHAVDCMLAEACGLGRMAYLSEGVAAGWREHILARMMAELIDSCMKGRDGGPSTFLLDSRAQDARGRGRAYWATPVEMFARAFECWVHDALAARGRRNDFLVSRHAGELVEGLEWRALESVYPKGRERTTIVWYMDEFMKAAMPIARGRLSGESRLTD